MAHTILVPHDGSMDAQQALEYAIETFPESRLVLFYAIDPFQVTPHEEKQLPPLSDDWLEDQREIAEEIMGEAIDKVSEAAEDATLEIETTVGSPAESIVATAEDLGVDQIVIGSRGRGAVAKAWMGSTAELVVKRASVPVTVVR